MLWVVLVADNEDKGKEADKENEMEDGNDIEDEEVLGTSQKKASGGGA